MISRWRAAVVIKNNYPFSDPGFEPAFRPGKAVTNGKAKFVKGKETILQVYIVIIHPLLIQRYL
jgi:hypothetical protein